MVNAMDDALKRKESGLGRSQSQNEPIFFKMRNNLLPWVSDEQMKKNRPLPQHLMADFKRDELNRFRFIMVTTFIVTGVCLLGRTRYIKNKFENPNGAYPAWFKQK